MHIKAKLNVLVCFGERVVLIKLILIRGQIYTKKVSIIQMANNKANNTLTKLEPNFSRL